MAASWRVLRWLGRVWRNWRQRHRHPISLAMHAVGIPMTLVAIPFLCVGWWWTAAGLFFGGYALQFFGHAIEGNDPGELVLVKRALGLPYRAVAPEPAHANDASHSQQNFSRP
ncbi:hypothetical protein HRbin36_01661 [bacterium HR36]|uniref:Hypothetical conserved protein n=1 Tax=uncultured Planctomycetota bacterium TaxID=120965 RepID=H5SCZ7_9BACT|nr:hypothetical conserved protein [uncultured Planctomycetota bacterium]GBD36536.1 hypothetical protein HRbin36_01661 [bacterium HR36]